MLGHGVIAKGQLMARDGTGDSPQILWYYVEAAQLKLALGDATAARAMLAHVPLSFNPHESIWRERVKACLYLRDYDAMGSLMAQTPEEIRPNLFGGLSPNTQMEGMLARYREDEVQAQAIFAPARKNIEIPWGREKSQSEKLIYLAICDAGLGHKTEAIGEAHESVALVSKAENSEASRGRRISLAMITHG